MIIVEGADNVGKSTLIKQLIELEPSLRILHRDKYKPELGQSIATSYVNALLPKDGDRVRHNMGIVDRMLASECIYGDLFRDGCRMSESEHLAVLSILYSYRAIVIFCDTPDDVIEKSWKTRTQLYDNPLEISRSYRERMDMIFPDLEIYKYDWTSADAAIFRRMIVDRNRALHRQNAARLRWWSVNPHGCGRLTSARGVIVLQGNGRTESSRTPFDCSSVEEDLVCRAIRITELRLKTRFAHLLYITPAKKNTNRDRVLLQDELEAIRGPFGTPLISIGQASDVVDSVCFEGYNYVDGIGPKFNYKHVNVAMRSKSDAMLEALIDTFVHQFQRII